MALNAGTYEARNITDFGEVIRFTVAAGTTISKGTVCKYADTVTAIRTSATKDNTFAGISATDKGSTDNSTTLGLHQGGIWEMRVDDTGGIAAGQLCCASGANNQIRAATISGGLIGEIGGDIISGQILGRCLETASNAEEVAVLVGAR